MYELIYVCIYVTRCMNSLFELDECCYQQIVFCFRLCFLLQTKCRLCFLSSSNGWADVSKTVATVDLSSDGQMMPARPLLLWTTVATDIFSLLLLSYHCSDTLLAMGRLPVATMTYGLLLQCLIMAVSAELQASLCRLPPRRCRIEGPPSPRPRAMMASSLR
jgi:hypothetical protein